MSAVVTLPVGTPAPSEQVGIRELETELLGLAGNIAAAQCRFLRLLAEFDRRNGWAGVGVRSCAHWLCWRAGMSLRTAAEHVRVAHALEQLPRIAEAFAAGQISYSKVRALTRVVGDDGATLAACAAAAQGAGSGRGDPPGHAGASEPAEPTDSAEPTEPAEPGEPGESGETTGPGESECQPTTAEPGPAEPGPAGVADPEVAEQVLLNLALSGTASHVETVVRAVRRRRARPQDLAARRSLSWSWDQDGSLLLRGRFTPDDGAALTAAIEALMPPRVPVAHPVPAPPQGWLPRAVEQEPGMAADRIGARRADALVALTTGQTHPHETNTEPAATSRGPADTGAEPDDGEPDDTEKPGACPAGAQGGPVVARGGADLIVHLQLDTATATGARIGGVRIAGARIGGGPEIAASTAQRLACDARVQLLLDDRDGNRLYLGRRRRLATPAQIAALTVRDGERCQFPGCAHTHYLHAHHVISWLQGGPTDIDNLVLTCSFHHRVIHDHDYRIHRDRGGWQFLRPDGTPTPPCDIPLTGNVESLIEIAARDGLRIDRDSLTPNWGGEPLDPEPILDTLLPRHPPRTTAA